MKEIKHNLTLAVILTGIFISFIIFIVPATAQEMFDEAEKIFKQSKVNVFQIQVIDLASGKKSSTGSGFYIDADGHMATNYHVVSSYALDPKKYAIKFFREDNTSADVHLVDIDVIHDLAILKSSVAWRFFLFRS